MKIEYIKETAGHAAANHAHNYFRLDDYKIIKGDQLLKYFNDDEVLTYYRDDADNYDFYILASETFYY